MSSILLMLGLRCLRAVNNHQPLPFVNGTTARHIIQTQRLLYTPIYIAIIESILLTWFSNAFSFYIL